VEELKSKMCEYRNLLNRKSELAAQIDAVKADIGVLNFKIREEFERMGIQNMTVPEVGKFFLRSETHPTVESQEALINWLKERDDYDMLLSFNTNKFKSYYKELLKNNEELPLGVTQFIKTDVVVHKA